MISKDPEVRSRYQSDPLIYKGKIRARKGYEVMMSMEYVMERFTAIDLPILVMHGVDDKITDPLGSQMLFDGVSSNDKSLKYFDGLYHEIFNEPERVEVMFTTPSTRFAIGLDMQAENRGFWRRIAPKSVEPERGSPDMKWKVLSGIAALR